LIYERQEEFLLVWEVKVDRTLRRARLFDDIVHARRVIALVREHVEGSVEDAVAGGAQVLVCRCFEPGG
jgi:hypothetical protein